MKKQFKNVALVNLVITLIGAVFILITDGSREFFLSVGIALLILAIINIIVGLVISIIATGYAPFKGYGAAMLLLAGISLLCSFTFCSIQPFRL